LKLPRSPRDDLSIRYTLLTYGPKGKGDLVARDANQKRELPKLNNITRGKRVSSHPRVVDAHAHERVHISDRNPTIFQIHLRVNKREGRVREDNIRGATPTDEDLMLIESVTTPLNRAVTVLPLVYEEYSHELPEEKHREYVDSDRDARRD
jgi:hypothetical protein